MEKGVMQRHANNRHCPQRHGGLKHRGLKYSGFTIIEILVSLTVAGILIGVAAPQFSKIMKSNRLTTSVNDMVHSLNLTRSEAMKSNRASICISNNQSSCTGGNWNEGWIVFNDLNGNCSLDGSELVIYARDSLKNRFDINTIQNITCITYSGEGFLFPAGSLATFTFCEPDADIGGKIISVIRSGRPSTGKYTACPTA